MAIQAGKSILVEKPLCTSIKSGKEILAAYHLSKNTIAVGYHLRWHAGLRKVAQAIHKNELGNIHHMRLHWAVNFVDHAKWRIDSKNVSWCCLSTLGTHLIDFVRWTMIPVCGEIEEIKSFIKNINHSYSDGTVLIIMRFRSGATVEIFCSVLFDSPFDIAIYGEKNNIFGKDLAGKDENRKIMIGNEVLFFEKNNPYVNQLDDFLKSILENRKPEVSLEEGFENVKNLVSISENNLVIDNQSFLKLMQ